MQTVPGRYSIKIRHASGDEGWGTWDIGPGQYKESMEDVLRYYRGAKGVQLLAVKPEVYPWEPPPSKEQQDYAAVVNGVVQSGDLSENNILKIASLQPPGVTPTGTPNAAPMGTLVNSSGQPSGLSGTASSPLAQALQSSVTASTPPAAAAATPVATLKNAAGNEIQITLDGSAATSQRLSELVQQGYAVQSTTGNPDFQAQTPPSPLANALSGNGATAQPTTQAVGTNATASTGGTATLPTTTPTGPSIAVLMPNQTTQTFSINDPALDAALQSGARPVNGGDGGIHTDIRQFQGGWIVNAGGGYVPLNVFAGGEWLPGQQEAFSQAGIQAGQLAVNPGGGTNTGAGTTGGGSTATPPGSTGNTGTTPTYQNNGWSGDPNATAPAMSSDLEDALRELMQEARNQGVRGQQALTGLVDDYKNYLGFTRSAAEQTFNRRDQLTDALLGKLTPAINSAIGTMNESTGLSPEAMAALRGQAIEGTQRDYQGQVQELKSQLGARGAYGGGSNPGDFNAILSGYAPLMQGRDAQRSNLLANTILANEQRKFDTLNLNRSTAMSALGTGAGLTSALAGAYNPASMFSANEGALSGLLNTVNSGQNAQMGGIQTAGNLANVWQESQPGSFRNTLLAALLGTGMSALPNLLPNIFGNGNQGSGTGGLTINLGGNGRGPTTPPYVP